MVSEPPTSNPEPTTGSGEQEPGAAGSDPAQAASPTAGQAPARDAARGNAAGRDDAVKPGGGGASVETASLNEAYLDIPDEKNPAIVDARKTYLVTVIMAAVFIGVVFLFIL